MSSEFINNMIYTLESYLFALGSTNHFNYYNKTNNSLNFKISSNIEENTKISYIDEQHIKDFNGADSKLFYSNAVLPYNIFYCNNDDIQKQSEAVMSLLYQNIIPQYVELNEYNELPDYIITNITLGSLIQCNYNFVATSST